MDFQAKLRLINSQINSPVKISILGNCGICNKVVTDEGCTAFGKFYHKECFKCGGCRQKINGKFFERSGKPYCQKCFMVRT